MIGGLTSEQRIEFVGVGMVEIAMYFEQIEAQEVYEERSPYPRCGNDDIEEGHAIAHVCIPVECRFSR